MDKTPLTCKIFGHPTELYIDLDSNEITLRCSRCGENRNVLLSFLDGKECSLTFPTGYTLYRGKKPWETPRSERP